MDGDMIKAIDDLRDAVAGYVALTCGDEIDCEFDSTEPVEAIKEIAEIINGMS